MRKNMMKGQMRNTVAAVIVAVLTSHVSLAACMDRSERAADKIRFVQSNLMVGAIQCRAHGDFRSLYNNFVTLNKQELRASYSNLAIFLKTNRKAPIDRYLVKQANVISASSHSTDGFCQKMIEVAKAASTGTPPVELLSKLPIPYQSDHETCTELASVKQTH